MDRFLPSQDLLEKEELEWQFRAFDHFGAKRGACSTDVRFFNHSETWTFSKIADENHRHEGTFGVNTEVVRLGGSGMVIRLSSLLTRTGKRNSILKPRQ
jgi:hypothetical protein